MINGYWENLEFQIQEGPPCEWTRIVDTALPSSNDFANSSDPLRTLSYLVQPRSVVVLVRLS